MTVEATIYAVEVKITDKNTGASDGWQTYCPNHKTMLLAIACQEKARAIAQGLYESMPASAKDALNRHRAELQIVKLTREIVEAAEEFIPAK